MTRGKYGVALFTLAAVALAAALMNRADAAQGQVQNPGGSGRIVVVNLARVVQEMQEKKDLEARFNTERQNLAREERDMKDQIKKLQDQRDNFRADSPQYEDVQRQYLQAVGRYKAWGETFMAEQDWRMKRLTRMLHDKVTAAVGEYASRQGIDVVLSDVQPQASEKELNGMNLDQLRAFLSQRRVLHASKQADISDAVIALLDSKYRAEGGVGAAGGGQGAPIPAAGAGQGQGGPIQGRTNNR